MLGHLYSMCCSNSNTHCSTWAYELKGGGGGTRACAPSPPNISQWFMPLNRAEQLRHVVIFETACHSSCFSSITIPVKSHPCSDRRLFISGMSHENTGWYT